MVAVSFATPYAYRIHTPHLLLMHLLLVQGVSVLWTIPPEIQFYVLFAFAWMLLSRRPILTAVVVSGALLGLYLLDYQGDRLSVPKLSKSFDLARALPFFLVGCVLGRCYGSRSRLARFQSTFWLFALPLILVLCPNIFVFLFGFHHEMWKSVGVLAVLGFVFVAVVFLVPAGQPLLENQVGDFYGRISYSLYLLHLLVFAGLAKLGWTGWGVVSLLIFVASATGAAWLSYTVIERPCRDACRQAWRRMHPDTTPAAEAPPVG